MSQPKKDNFNCVCCFMCHCFCRCCCCFIIFIIILLFYVVSVVVVVDYNNVDDNTNVFDVVLSKKNLPLKFDQNQVSNK